MNLVGGEPTPNLVHILQIAKFLEKPLPIIWNSNMYMSLETMEVLRGFVDLFLADFKYGNDECALRLSAAPKYVEVVFRNHKIGAEFADLLVRHLVLPNHVECCSKPVIDMLSEIPALVHIMSQYWPAYKAREYRELSRRITREEYYEVVEYARQKGLEILLQPI